MRCLALPSAQKGGVNILGPMPGIGGGDPLRNSKGLFHETRLFIIMQKLQNSFAGITNLYILNKFRNMRLEMRNFSLKFQRDDAG